MRIGEGCSPLIGINTKPHEEDTGSTSRRVSCTAIIT